MTRSLPSTPKVWTRGEGDTANPQAVFNKEGASAVMICLRKVKRKVPLTVLQRLPAVVKDRWHFLAGESVEQRLETAVS